MVHAREDSGMSTVLATVGATSIWVIVCSSRAPLQTVVSTVLTEEKRDTVPPVFRTLFLEDDNGTLPVVTMVVVVLVVQAVDYAPACIIWAVYSVGVDGEGAGTHEGAGELLAVWVALDTSLAYWYVSSGGIGGWRVGIRTDGSDASISADTRVRTVSVSIVIVSKGRVAGSFDIVIARMIELRHGIYSWTPTIISA
jgi:hypothetical protein